MIEALACGTPVAAFPVPGPLDILDDSVGAMSDNLDHAISAALTRDRAQCARFGAGYSWEAATRQFLNGLVALEEEQSTSLQGSARFLGGSFTR
jgi:glycosyltransferase involved in cell wall biosynthesis